VAVALGYVVLGEALDRVTLAGAALVLVGIAVATWPRRAAKTAIPEPAAEPGDRG
jgi:drug/metabolite transporter (DMT)-like permease